MNDLLSFVRATLAYDPASGHLTWRSAPGYNKNWRIGQRAGTRGPDGYRVICLQNHSYREHRIVWLHVFGALPSLDLDHINGQRDDNRIANLREVTDSENAQNLRRARVHSRTGALGVFPAGKKFKAAIGLLGKTIHLGTFPTLEEARLAYLEAKRQHHPANTI